MSIQYILTTTQTEPIPGYAVAPFFKYFIAFINDEMTIETYNKELATKFQPDAEVRVPNGKGWKIQQYYPTQKKQQIF